MHIQFYNCPAPERFDTKLLPKEKPLFVQYQPDFKALEETAKQYAQYRNVLVVAHGGSITSFQAFYSALKELGLGQTVRAYFLNTVDPDYIAELKSEITPENTVVVAISKSGETVTQLEALSQFFEYPLICICGKGSTLHQIGEKLGAALVVHPPIGGRFTGFTEVGLLPALLCGLDADALLRGAREMYALYEKDNLPWRAASVLWQLEQAGYVDVFMPFYSHGLFASAQVVVQLCHESFGKDGKGQTFLASEAPESQHHTNQRFFGGLKNMAGFFVSVDAFHCQLQSQYPASLHSIQLRGSALFDLNKIPLGSSIAFEMQGTLENAKMSDIPLAHLSLAGLTPLEVGRFVAFWQLFAVYSSQLRRVDPFDQPQVELSKKISFNKRLAYKGLAQS